MTGSTRKSGATASTGNHYHTMADGTTGSASSLPSFPNYNELGWAMVGIDTSLALMDMIFASINSDGVG